MAEEEEEAETTTTETKTETEAETTAVLLPKRMTSMTRARGWTCYRQSPTPWAMMPWRCLLSGPKRSAL